MSYINETNRGTKLTALVVATGFLSCFGSTLQAPPLAAAIRDTDTIDNEYDNSTEVMYDDKNYMHMPNGEKLKIITHDILIDDTNHYTATKK